MVSFSPLGLQVITGVVVGLSVLVVLNALFVLWRDHRLAQLQEKARAKNALGKELTFHSPDDTPRTFLQFGFKQNLVGYVLLRSWPALFCAGYIYMIVFCFLSYAPDWPLPYSDWLPRLPTYYKDAFGGWSGIVGCWLVIFTLVHILGMLLIIFWEAGEARFMVPVATLGEASHVLIEEEVPFMTDDDLEDPDSDSVSACFKGLHTKMQELKVRFKRAKCRTIVPVREVQHGHGSNTWTVKTIEYTCVRYVYEEQSDSFRPVGTAGYEPKQIHDSLRKGGLTEDEARESIITCGPNAIKVRVPSRLEALVTEFSDFTGVFASMGTWAYYVWSTWNLGLFWVVLTWSSGVYRALFIMRPSRKKTAELAQLHGTCEVLRGGMWKQVHVEDIALGDILRVPDGSTKLPCDGIVIQGSLVVNESMLTGEPMPIQKMPIEDSTNAAITKKNIAYAGTLCLQSTNPNGGHALMIASAVGALTTRGQLVRMVLFPTTVRFKYNDQLPIVYGIMFIYMLFVITIYVLFVNLGDWISLYLQSLSTVAQSLSPMLPVSLIAGQTVSARRLSSNLEIACLQPSRIPIAGKISTMVFDKTGTITKDGMDFDAVVSVDKGTFGPQVSFDTNDSGGAKNQEVANNEVPPLLLNALASCHTVTVLKGHNQQFVGNQVEISMVSTVGWNIHEDKMVSPDGSKTLEIVKKMEFDHHRMTSGVVVRCQQTNQLIVYVKGSYEKVASLSQSIPADYKERTERYAQDGYYVLGIAMKQLPPTMTQQDVVDMARDSLEADLSVCGLLLFRNEMKPASPEAIEELKKGSIRSVICTGDNELTGVSIGRQCGIVTTAGVLIGDLQDGNLVWRDPQNPDAVVDPEKRPSYELAVKQGAWRYLATHTYVMEPYWQRIVVFARMKPDDKINVVKYFQARKLVTGMCGDGGNDCGGLRAAHAGLALSDAEASLVAPFASGRDGKSLMTVVDMVREGRACLATNLATFQYFMVYGFTLTGIRVLLNLYNAGNLGEYVWIAMDIGVGVFMVTWFGTVSKPSDKLSPYRPTATLLGPRTLSAIVFPFLTGMLCMVISLIMLWSQSWYDYLNPVTDIHIPGRYWMLRGDNYTSAVTFFWLMLILVNTAYVNTYGGDFRRNIVRNVGINVMYFTLLSVFLVLNFSKPTQFNCVFRINCDTEHSVAARSIPIVAGFSTGGIGGCFLGPQTKIWQQEMATYGWTGEAPTGPDGSCSPTGAAYSPAPGKDGMCPYWLPDVKENDCVPWNSLKGAGGVVPPNDLTTENSLEIDVNGCSGPNNCFGLSFKWALAVVMFIYVVANHAFAKLVLQGPGVKALRELQQRKQKQHAVELS